MRFIVIADGGLSYGGRDYKKGDELELHMDQNRADRAWSVSFLARRLIKPADPVILGTAPPAPKPPEPAPSTEVHPITTQDIPNASDVPQRNAETPEPGAPTEAWIQPPWQDEPPATLVEGDPEADKRRGRTARRDLRPKE